MAGLPSCGHSTTTPPPPTGAATAREAISPPPAPAGPTIPLDRIAIVGASISAGLDGTPFGDAFTAAAPRSQLDGLHANPVGVFSTTM